MLNMVFQRLEKQSLRQVRRNAIAKEVVLDLIAEVCFGMLDVGNVLMPPSR